MITLGFDKPLYVLPFGHRGSFKMKMVGAQVGAYSAAQFEPRVGLEIHLPFNSRNLR